jgi:putative peptidoglycan lipid II flippase
VKGIAVGRELLIAERFGVSSALDAYVLALLPVSMAINILTGSLNSALIPTYVIVRKRDGDTAAANLLARVSFRTAILLLAAITGLAFAGPRLFSIFAAGFSAEKSALSFDLLLRMLPAIWFSGMATLWTAVLNAEGDFALGALAPALPSIVIFVAAALFARPFGISAIAWATTIGACFHAIAVGLALRARNIRVWNVVYGESTDSRLVQKQYWPALAGALILSSTTLVDQALATLLPSGSLSSLYYGDKLASQVTSLFTLTLSTALLPTFSHLVAEQDWAGLRELIRKCVVLITAVTIPATIALLIYSKPLVVFLYERGAFTAGDSSEVSRIQQMFVIQVPFYALGILFVRLIAALRRNHVLIWGTVVSVCLNALLDIVLMKRMGAAGIALATSIIYVVSAGLLGAAFFYYLRKAEESSNQLPSPQSQVSSRSGI